MFVMIHMCVIILLNIIFYLKKSENEKSEVKATAFLVTARHRLENTTSTVICNWAICLVLSILFFHLYFTLSTYLAWKIDAQ